MTRHLLPLADRHPLLAFVLGFVAVFVPVTGWALVDVLTH